MPVPPRPPPPSFKSSVPLPRPKPPIVAPNGPPGALLVELNTYSGSPFNDHWAYFVRSSQDLDVGVVFEAVGDVRTGFKLEIERNYSFALASSPIATRVPLQWIDAKYVDEKAMLDNGNSAVVDDPICIFEECLRKVKVPEETLNNIEKTNTPAKRVVQRNCQTWIVEAADQLVRDGIFNPDVAAYLHGVKQCR
ncbi:hypothetical protein FSARC_3002 [Fusarium sarcochroum]|uniref:Uncharacterized protein n=1 Tax=Fusarium sarcochroum TaxID=1208366 RepID=A0A8H4XD68_9HYPO|nr:hypothetical protein FSARC_3002 [Fusarium sarcochroum]